MVGVAFLYYVAINLVVPEKKYYFLSLFLIIIIIISFFYIFDFENNIKSTPPNISGEDIISTSAKLLSPIFFLMIINSLFFLGFNVIGLILRSIQSRGIIKNKFLELGIGNLLFLVFFVIYAISQNAILKLIMRIGEIGSIVIIYFSLREAPEKPEEVRPKKEIKVKNDKKS